jgi:hypothetical protein
MQTLSERPADSMGVATRRARADSDEFIEPWY